MALFDEILYLVIIVILFIHCYRYKGRSYAVRIFVVGFFMGLLIENSGVLQGSYTEWGYLLYFPGSLVPLITQLGWIMVTYVSISMSETIFDAFPKLKTNIVFMAIMTGLLATFWDVLIDPLSVYEGDWVWTEQSWGPNGIGWLGIPILNWLAWFWCMFAWSLHIYYIDSKEDWSETKSIGIQFLSILTTALVLLVSVEISFFIVEGVWLPIWNPPAIPPDYPWAGIFN